MEPTQNRPFQNKKRYLWAFIIGTAIFALVFIISNSIAFLEFQKVSNIQDSLAYKIFEDKIYASFFNQSICTDNSLQNLSQDLGFQGQIIDDMEKKFGKNDPQVLDRKKFYTLVELEHLEFIQAQIKNCNLSMNTILFFYSNKDPDLERSTEIGRLLNEVYLKEPDKITIYSFDINLDSDLIRSLLQKYNVTQSPTLIINGNATVTEPIRIENVQKYLF
ncbi:MAG TPA: hypothetical protein VMC07_03325 [Candidatus Omnitrophota bacterium]|nr:hypothetical protein [Candidatus Omnitrophota bacterium]